MKDIKNVIRIELYDPAASHPFHTGRRLIYGSRTERDQHQNQHQYRRSDADIKYHLQEKII